MKVGLRFLLDYLFVDIMNYWGIELGQIAPNEVRQIATFILICKAFGIPTNLEALKNFIDIKPMKEGSRWHTFQKKDNEKFHIEVAQSIYG